MSDKILDLMLQSLDKEGVLAKVKAQIKASVYKIIDQAAGKKSGGSQYFWENDKAVNLHKDNNLLLLLEIVKEFLQFFDFNYTLAVLVSESNHKDYIKRENLIQKLGILKTDLESTQPVLQLLVQKFNPKNPKQVNEKQSVNQTPTTSSKQLKEKQQPLKVGEQTKKVDSVKKEIQKATPQSQDSQFQFEEIEEDLDNYNTYQPQKKTSSQNLMLTSSEEFLASQSQGMDITVDSEDIMQYDHVEEIKKKK
ncbi:hypothetical protein pb186bvf_016952 [Paramecium bursaria]